jgi:methyl-accepting chemotaxis protein
MRSVPLALQTPVLQAIIGVFVFALVLTSVIIVRPGGNAGVDLISNILQDIAVLAATIICFTYTVQLHNSRARLGWYLVGAGLACGFIGDILFTYNELQPKPVFPSPGDIFFSTFPILTLIGLLVQPSVARRGLARARLLLDALVIALSLVTISWYFLLGPLLLSSGTSPLGQLVALWYPFSDVLMLSSVLIVLLRDRESPLDSAFGLVALGILFYVLSDSGFAYENLTSLYVTGNFIDIGWAIGFLLIGIGAMGAVVRERQGATQAATTPPERDAMLRIQEMARSDTQRLLVSYGLVILLLIITIMSAFTHPTSQDMMAMNSYHFVESGLIVLVAVVIALASSRQFLTLVENTQLNFELQGLYTQLRELNAATTAQRDAIERQVEQLIEEVAGIGDGDLRRRAQVTAGSLGVIADAINYVLEELSSLIGRVQGTANEVDMASQTILQRMAALDREASGQVVEIAGAIEAMNAATESSRAVASHAAIASSTARQALTDAARGRDAMRRNLEGMARVRDNVRDTAQEIERLAQRSTEISQFVRMVDEIAERTNILALSASVQASAAGYYGQGFAVVADEVRQLAARSSQMAAEIASLAQSIRADAVNSHKAMEIVLHEVEGGSAMADQARDALGTIYAAVERQAEAITAISAAASTQVELAERALQAMERTGQFTKATAAGINDAARGVAWLAQRAQLLRASVSAFKLPEPAPNGQQARISGPLASSQHLGRSQPGATGNGLAPAPQQTESAAAASLPDTHRVRSIRPSNSLSDMAPVTASAPAPSAMGGFQLELAYVPPIPTAGAAQADRSSSGQSSA